MKPLEAVKPTAFRNGHVPVQQSAENEATFSYYQQKRHCLQCTSTRTGHNLIHQAQQNRHATTEVHPNLEFTTYGSHFTTFRATSVHFSLLNQPFI